MVLWYWFTLTEKLILKKVKKSKKKKRDVKQIIKLIN